VDDDAAVVKGSLGTPALFAEIFDRHFQAVFTFCARRVGTTVAEDLAGETFRSAFQARDHFDLGNRNVRPWLYGIARNLINNDSRRRGREAAAYRRLASLETIDLGDPAGATGDSIDAERRLARVRVALEALAPEESEPLLLHVWEGLSYEEIAEVMDVAVGTVRSRIHRVRAKLAASSNAHQSATPLPPSTSGGSRGHTV
jgi:RNA polymerase sigma factor (sigma-70 family)